MTFTIRAKGFNSTKFALKRFSKRIDRQAGRTVKGVGEATRDIARSFAPYDTGALVAAIHFKPSKIRGGWHSKVISDVPKGNAGRDPSYNVRIEKGWVSPTWGTKFKKSRDRLHFMTKAFEFAKEKFPKTLTDRIKIEVRNIR